MYLIGEVELIVPRRVPKREEEGLTHHPADIGPYLLIAEMIKDIEPGMPINNTIEEVRGHNLEKLPILETIQDLEGLFGPQDIFFGHVLDELLLVSVIFFLVAFDEHLEKLGKTVLANVLFEEETGLDCFHGHRLRRFLLLVRRLISLLFLL